MTIFCHGTKSYSDEVKKVGDKEFGEDDQELVWVLEKHFHMPTELQEDTFNGGKLLLHGVGSLNDPTANRVLRTGDGLQGSSGSSWAAGRVLNMLDGNGIGRNIEKAITFLEYMVDNRQRPRCINMVGWSRGGVTCVRLAQALYENSKLRDIEVNIFAGDPVPGAGRHNTWALSKKYAITPNVKKYLQVMAMHVSGLTGLLFKPLHPAVVDAGRTSIGVLPMPGTHRQVVSAGISSSGKITLDMAVRFLRMCGSEGAETKKISEFKLANRQIYDYYQQIFHAAQSDDGTFAPPTQPGFLSAIGSTMRYTRNTDARKAGLDYMKIGYVNHHHHLLAYQQGQAHGGPQMNPGLQSMLSTMYV
jgi:hypothetical protein